MALEPVCCQHPFSPVLHPVSEIIALHEGHLLVISYRYLLLDILDLFFLKGKSPAHCIENRIEACLLRVQCSVVHCIRACFIS